jgi:hypothetical protein
MIYLEGPRLKQAKEMIIMPNLIYLCYSNLTFRYFADPNNILAEPLDPPRF